MRWLTTERGRQVADADGTPLGRVTDLVIAIDSGEHHPLVTRLVIGKRGHTRLLDVHDLARYDDDSIILSAGTRPIAATLDRGTVLLRNDELLLSRDVLDTQVVDLEGHRLARVADLALDRRDDGRLRVDGVDVGTGRILARLGLHTAGRERFIDWDDLHLTSRRGHVAQLAAPRAAVHRLDAAGLAALIEHLNVTAGSQVLTAVPPETAAAALERGHHHLGERVLRALPTDTAHRIVAVLPHPRRHHWESHLGRQRPLRGRRFHRTKGWRRHHRVVP